MAGICGWLATVSDQSPRESTADQMEKCLPPRGEISSKKTSPNSGMVALATTQGMAAFEDNGIQAALDGSPRWIDTDLHAVAQAQGHAAALLKAYQQHGTEFFKYLHGAFALAILDPENKLALLAIDRIGIQPMCYSRAASGTLVFGSTTGSVRNHPAVKTSINPQAVYNYVYFHVIPSPNTIFREINKLEPGQFLLCRNGDINIQRYWQPTFLENTETPFESLKDEVKRLLRTAVQRCESDQQSGAFLSGGLDSSTVTGMLADIRKGQSVPTYSIGFEAQGYDEMEYARITAKHFGTDMHELYVTTDDVIDAIPLLAKAYDEPFGNASAIPTYFCARLAHDNGTGVMLAGDGGDELFGGNERYATQKLFNYYTLLPKWLRKGVLEPVCLGQSFSSISLTRKAQRYIEQARLPMPGRMQTYNFLHIMSADSVFASDFLNTVNTDYPDILLTETYNQAPAQSLLNRMLYLDWKFTLADNDLRKVNRMCDVAGVKVCYPFLDDDMVEFSARVPPSMKLKGMQLRYFYKKAFEDFLPQETIKKTKHGFGLPFGEWLKTSPKLQERVYSNLQQLKNRNIFRPVFIDQAIQAHRTNHAAYYGTMVWILAMLEQWFQEHG